MRLEASKRALERSQLFRGLSGSYLDLILMICQEQRQLAGSYVFRQGDPGDAVYLIASGSVDIVLEPRDQQEAPITVASLPAASTFGEVTLLESGGERTASARCATDVQLIRIPGARLLRLCREYPEIGAQVMYRIAAELAAKLRSSNVSIRNSHLFSGPHPAGEPTVAAATHAFGRSEDS
jgi:CRP/FNR family transcriptional regulator